MSDKIAWTLLGVIVAIGIGIAAVALYRRVTAPPPSDHEPSIGESVSAAGTLLQSVGI